MEKKPLTFDQLPTLVYELGCKVDSLASLLDTLTMQQHPPADRWLSIEELSNYLPGNPAITTLYGKVQRREIPFSRNGKRLAFKQSSIDAWLQSKNVKTAVELDGVADHRIIARRFCPKANV